MYTKNDFLTTLPGILFMESVHNTFMECSFGSVIKKLKFYIKLYIKLLNCFVLELSVYKKNEKLYTYKAFYKGSNG